MTPRSLFNIILKIFGLFFLREIVNAVPQLISSILYLFAPGAMAEGIIALLFGLAVLALYGFLVLKLLFNTNYVLDKLKLAEGFGEEKFSVTIPTTQMLTLGLIIVAGVVLIEEIPELLRQITLYMQQKRLMGNYNPPDHSLILVAAAKIVLALLIQGERKKIVDFALKNEGKEVEDMHE